MKLAGLAVQSVLYGIFIAMAFAMLYLLCRRPQPRQSAHDRPVNSWLISGLAILTVTAITHWIAIVVRAFEAFVFWRGGHMALAYYAGSTRSGMVKFAFHGATSVIADIFVIARLYIIWNYRKSVVIAPLLFLLGFATSCIGCTYAYGVYDKSKPETLIALHRWRLSFSVCTICTTVYCTTMIVWYIWRLRYQNPERTVNRTIKSVIVIIIESAALYTSVVILSRITYEVGHISKHFFVDCTPPVAAITAVLVHARAVLLKVRQGG
uniref:Uncharacterized protein n=2 Tax=Schizophyllum commune (strain H4-8 / FGSC 9210) TaxID=578458 RepID=D8QEU4_SCHCM